MVHSQSYNPCIHPYMVTKERERKKLVTKRISPLSALWPCLSLWTPWSSFTIGIPRWGIPILCIPMQVCIFASYVGREREGEGQHAHRAWNPIPLSHTQQSNKKCYLSISFDEMTLIHGPHSWASVEEIPHHPYRYAKNCVKVCWRLFKTKICRKLQQFGKKFAVVGPTEVSSANLAELSLLYYTQNSILYSTRVVFNTTLCTTGLQLIISFSL